MCFWPGGHPAEVSLGLAGYCGLDPRGLTLRRLFALAHGRRREERQRIVEQAQWIGILFGERGTGWAVRQFVRTGELPDGSDREMPYDPAVEAKVAEIVAAGGKVVF